MNSSASSCCLHKQAALHPLKEGNKNTCEVFASCAPAAEPNQTIFPLSLSLSRLAQPQHVQPSPAQKTSRARSIDSRPSDVPSRPIRCAAPAPAPALACPPVDLAEDACAGRVATTWAPDHAAPGPPAGLPTNRYSSVRIPHRNGTYIYSVLKLYYSL